MIFFFKFQAMNLKLCMIHVATKDSLMCLPHCQGHVDLHCSFKQHVLGYVWNKLHVKSFLD